MFPSLQFLFLPLSIFFISCTANELLPRAPHADSKSPAFLGLHNVIVAREGDLDLPSAFSARMRYPADEPQKGISANSPSIINKRQFTCPSNYALCQVSQSCCPLGWGCCDDGSCVTDGAICCPNGGGICPSGWSCCGTFNCSPDGGQCCDDGSYCDAGLNCVTIDGVPGCCANLDCTSFDSGPLFSPPPSLTFPSFTPITVTPPSFASISVTTPSFTPPSFTPISFTPISFTPLSIPTFTFPSITIPAITVPTSLTTEYFWYTTTFTWFYYSYFITYIAPVSQRTSTQTSTTQIVSVYASNTADATSQFASISNKVSFPTAVTAAGFTNNLPSSTSSTSSGPTISAFTGGAKAVKTGSVGLGTAAVMGCLGMFTCLLMVWL